MAIAVLGFLTNSRFSSLSSSSHLPNYREGATKVIIHNKVGTFSQGISSLCILPTCVKATEKCFVVLWYEESLRVCINEVMARLFERGIQVFRWSVVFQIA